MQEPEHQDVWLGQHDGWYYKIYLHGKGEPYNCGGQGTWCYYIYIPERRLSAEDFQKLWLEPQPTEYSITSYDYYNTPVASLFWHGGVTYYEKHGEEPGKRCVEFGCDYNHLYDNHQDWSLRLILSDVKQTIKELNELYPSSNLKSNLNSPCNQP